MTDDSENKSEAAKPASPGFKKFTGAKLVPLPTPIAQPNDEEKFPVFLGVLIVLSMVALVSVFVLAFFSHKTKVKPVMSQNAPVFETSGASPSPAASIKATPSTSAH